MGLCRLDLDISRTFSSHRKAVITMRVVALNFWSAWVARTVACGAPAYDSLVTIAVCTEILMLHSLKSILDPYFSQ